MRHVSMLPPQHEPAYRVRLEQRKLRWVELERLRFEADLLREKVRNQLAVDQYMRERGPLVKIVG